MAVAAHDEVVEQADIDQGQRPGEPERDATICLAGFCDAGWVVVADYDCRGIVMQGPLEDLSRVDRRAIHRASEE